MSNCTTCPNVVGDSYERDCAFPDCVGGWEKAYIEATDEITRLRAENEALRKALGDAIEWNWLDDDRPEHLFRMYKAMAREEE